MSKRTELVQAIYNLEGMAKADLAEAVAAYLIQTHQTKDIDSLMRDLEALRYSKNGVREITVSAAHELDPKTRDMIKQLFSAKKVIIHEEKDAKLLGGVRVQAYDQELDLSVRTRLQRLKTGAEVKGTD